jgi:hypothetical protein
MLVEEVHPEHEDDQETDGERRLDDHERGMRVRDDLRPDPDQPKQKAEDPSRPGDEPSEQREPKAERTRRDARVESLQNDPDVEEQRRHKRRCEPEHVHTAILQDGSLPLHLDVATERATPLSRVRDAQQV